MKKSVAIGEVFSDWTVVGPGPIQRPPKVECRCVCGVEKYVNVYNLLAGTSKGCGCGKDKRTGERNLIHGKSHTGAYKSWLAMWCRCTNANSKSYATYKDRAPPPAWRDFQVFLSDVGERPAGTSIERLDNSKPYGPGNCVWATPQQQSFNRRNVIKVLFNGQVVSFKAACKLAGVIYVTAKQRVREQGMPVHEAIPGAELFKE